MTKYPINQQTLPGTTVSMPSLSPLGQQRLRVPPVIGLVGYPGSGKDTVADLLVRHGDFAKVSIADGIRAYLENMNPPVPIVLPSGGTVVRPLQELLEECGGWDHAKRTHPMIREYLENTGEAMRNLMDNILWWFDLATSRAPGKKRLVISDVRLPEEALKVLDIKGELWLIERHGYGRISDDETDALPGRLKELGLPHRVVRNDLLHGLRGLEAFVVTWCLANPWFPTASPSTP